MSIGDKIDKIDDGILTFYTQSKRYSGNYKYKLEEIIIDTNDSEEVTYLFVRFDENYIKSQWRKSQNGENPKTTEDVKRILGENYQDNGYDRENKLREPAYIDNDNSVKAEFIKCADCGWSMSYAAQNIRLVQRDFSIAASSGNLGKLVEDVLIIILDMIRCPQDSLLKCSTHLFEDSRT